MNPKTYFRLSLLLPVAVPAAAYLVGPANMLFAMLMFSLLFGGPAYFLFAIVAFVWIGRLSSARAIQILSCFAPVVFFPFQAIVWLGWCYYRMAPNWWLADCLASLLPLTFYIAVLGYGYVAVVNLAWWGAAGLGWVRDDGRERDIDIPT